MQKYLIWFILMGLLSQCRKDFEVVDIVESTVDPPKITIIGDVMGQVLDEEGWGVSYARVTIGNRETFANEAGAFQLKNVALDQAGVLVKAEVVGNGYQYHPGYKTFIPQQGHTKYLVFSIIRKRTTGTFRAADGGSITTQDGGVLNFKANCISDANGLPFDGEVLVSAYWLDPGRTDLPLLMPGDLVGIDEEGNQQALGSYGMLAVSLSDRTRAKLQVSSGCEVEVKFPVPPRFANNAPTTIPLWYFDEDKGQWVAEGQASFDGHHFVGSVSHFSFWNCDIPYPLVNFKGRLIDLEGTPISQLGVLLEIASLNLAAYSSTDEEGFFEGKIPKNEKLKMSISNNLVVCETLFEYNEDIGPFNQDVDLGELVLDFSDNHTVITGRLLNCDGTIVRDGVVGIESDGFTNFLRTDNNGNFYGKMIYCGEGTVSITALDEFSEYSSETLTFPIAPEIKVDDLAVCKTTESVALELDLDGQKITFEEVYHQYKYELLINDSTLFIDSTDQVIVGETVLQNETYEVLLVIDKLQEGTFSNGKASFILQVYEGPNRPQNLKKQYTCLNPSGCEGFQLEVTEYGPLFKPIKGTFEGEVEEFDPPNGSPKDELVEISGSFTVTRAL